MTYQTQENERYVFQVTRQEIVRTEIIKAASQEEAENILRESDPDCSFQFLWIKPKQEIEKEPVYVWVRIFLFSGPVFLLTGFLLLIFRMPHFYFLLLFFVGLGCLLTAAIHEWWRNLKE